ncbi:MAG: WavE lipopolysaccharide synthesis family protein [Vicinamibacterales bacterium]
MTSPAHLLSPPSRWRLDEAQRALFDRRIRLIGWGSGSVFDYFHSLAPVPLDYLVDNDPSRWGDTRHGVPIRPPSALAREAALHTFVLIYSGAWPEIQAQIATLTEAPAVPASAVFTDAATRATLATADRLAATAPRRHVPASRDAIVVQGPVSPYTTAYVVRAMRAAHADASIILSTWDDTAVEDLDAIRPWVDQIVTSVRPATAGIQNRNLQIVSTRAGLEAAAARGARYVLKTRTDLAVLQPAVFDQARWWWDRVGHEAAQRAGLRERIVVPSCYTRAFLLYHPSDLVQLGTLADLTAFWSAPLDPREGSLLAPEWLDRPLARVNLDGNPTESYLGLAFCKTINRPVAGTLADSWACYRDLFAVVDNQWFDLLWCKNLAIPDAVAGTGLRETVSQALWQRLQFSDVARVAAMTRHDPFGQPLRALTERAA